MPIMSPEAAEFIARQYAEQNGIKLSGASVSHSYSCKDDSTNTSHPREDMWFVFFNFPKRFEYDDFTFCAFEVICSTGAVRAIPLN
jgi:hypothetical protein